MPTYLFLSFLLAIGCFRGRAQEPASASDKSKAEQSMQPAETLTADGMPLCGEKLKLETIPEGVYRIGGKVLPPVPLKTPEATFTDDARKYGKRVMKIQHLKRFEAKSLVGLTVDTDGVPRTLCLVDELGHGLDRRAFDAVSSYRFKPATLDGKPVPVRLTVEVTFALW